VQRDFSIVSVYCLLTGITLQVKPPFLQKPIKATNRHLSIIFFRSVDAWNALPPALRSSSSLPAFKRRLKQIDLSAYRKGSAIKKKVLK
jgi:hypothetical protein